LAIFITEPLLEKVGHELRLLLVNVKSSSMDSDIGKFIMSSHVSTWHMVFSTGGIMEVPALQLVCVVGIEGLLPVPVEAVHKLLNSKIVGVVIKLAVQDQNLKLTVIKDL